MDRRETERLLEAIRAARASAEPVALATVVRVRGSAYRREGTRMVVRQDGNYECALSGGCLEPVVAEAAARVIATGEPIVVNYDLADDSVWGLGIGCGGAVDVRIERLGDDEVTAEWLAVLERGDAAVLVTALSAPSSLGHLSGSSRRLLVRPTGQIIGSLGDASTDREAVHRALARLHASYPTSGTGWIGSDEFFFEIGMTAPELVLFGAGYDAVPIAHLAWTIGFRVTAVDVREAFLTGNRFPNATLIPAHFSQFTDAVKLGAQSFVVVMNHHIERDRESLRFALESETAYVGVLGPRARLQKLLAGLADQGYTPSASTLSRVRSPVGLSLGAETPTEVALSVLGEIVAIRRGFEGGFLSGSLGSLHRSADKRLLARS